MLDLRLIRAEVLKLRRRRGMLAIVAALTLGVVALVYTVMTVQHATNPAKYGPAGGLSNYRGFLEILLMLTIVAGAIVGSTAGAQDIESGVFRDLAATGRSRVALFGARVTGAWGIVVPIAAATTAAAGIASVTLAGSAAAPGAGALVQGTAAILATGAVSAAVAVGLCALVGSRGPVIAIMLAFGLALAPTLAAMSFLGDVRQAIPTVAVGRIAHTPGPTDIALATAIAVLVAWIAAAFAAGAWRTKTREI
jgi:ABC-type transport system involved in multi-copper enzyme maturation permease subunit